MRKRLSPEAVERLTSYEWPGNVRELINVIERCVLLTGIREMIVVNDFPEGMQAGLSRGSESNRPALQSAQQLSLLEEEHIEKTLRSVMGNKSKAARLLGISRKTLYNRLGRGAK